MLQLVYEVDHIFTHWRAIYSVHKSAILKPCIFSLKKKIKYLEQDTLKRLKALMLYLFFSFCRQKKEKLGLSHTNTHIPPTC